ncbi:MAG: serine/threonine-protein kinase [Bacteroidota bacterium]
MDANRWQQLENLFISALTLEGKEQAEFLDKACGDDAALRHELESMLHVDQDSVAFALENKLLNEEAPAQSRAADLIGSRIGPYRLEELLGEGGMGEVYLAQRNDGQYDQKVALKLVRPGYRSADLFRRFRMERQVLARLSHPNITQLLDGGIDNDGRPYLVMQYVEGLPITKFCDKHALSIEERLGLFRTVCAAVQHAHINLVVHRDIKPSNILVTEGGVVKLLDFGIAKLLAPDLQTSVALTQSRVRLMTPEYAAPEQVQGANITTATDVYALGVLLYEMLTGRRPYQLDKKILSEVERIICEETPLRPSTSLTEATHTKASIEAISSARRTGAARLRRTLQGDLDNIVLMALRKEPTRRYASAEQFAQDIQRYLEGLPVSAQKDRLSYRFKKFVFRHQTVVAVASAAFLLAIGFGIAMSIQARNLAIQRDLAQSEATKAQQVSAFLENMFEASDPLAVNTERRDTLRVRALLDIGVKNLHEELADQPQVKASLLHVLGNVYNGLGDPVAALPLLDEALSIRTTLYSGDHAEIAESMAGKSNILRQQGKFNEAEPLILDALAMNTRLAGAEHISIADDLQDLGVLRQRQGRYVEADSLFRASYQLRSTLLGPAHWDVASDLNNIATVQYLSANFETADSLFREVIAIRSQLRDFTHPDIVSAQGNLATTLRRQGKLDEAIALSQSVLENLRNRLGPVHPMIAGSLNNLGQLFKTQQKYAEAETHYKASLAMYQQVHGSSHPNIALILHNLGALYKAMRAYDEGFAHYEQALQMRRALFGNTHPAVAATLNNLGILLKSKRDYAGAEPYLREALAVNRKLLGADHPRIGITMDSLGDLLIKTGKYAEADSMLHGAKKILLAQFGPDNRIVKNNQKSLELLAEKQQNNQ